MSTDDDNPKALRERVRELEATVGELADAIDDQQQQQPPSVGRRSILASAAAAAGLGSLGTYGLSQRASAQASGPAGQVGTGSEPVDAYAWDLDVQNGAEFNGTDLTGVGAVDVDNATVNNPPTSDTDALRFAEGVEVGTVTNTGGTGLTGASDATWDTAITRAVSKSFTNAFATVPIVVVSMDRDSTTGPKDWIPMSFNKSTTGFDVVFDQKGTTDHDTSNNDQVAEFVASEGR